ncbi:MAG: ABC transporter permease [Actinomyces urogenitalis]|uniref:ABC transporter permease n=3 Tax=Actinomyces urogenitalis TaxID=103621 RepID=A0A2I1KTW5_9ACTO|nr:ABC transporter permease [Actinomyces urogenitalis]MBS5977517.1 ABC transporter permease [Actinomyces urogenitalis]MBS6072370.1 ABC transporter permease [Actinomyces urogenitalis]MDK8236877.1 ABC transporter permease [Actinomyces urogenitalis]MDK8835978.1 ABC transporter permease [Actinomyces urogenitalis]MDU0864675.1 ABC transporter permease [Actinomyces urogenitalis]
MTTTSTTTRPSGATPDASMSAWAEIRLVAGRELRTQLLKKSAVISQIIMMVLVVAGIVAYGYFSGGQDEPYRLGVTGSSATAVQALTDAAGSELTTSSGRPVEIVDLTGQDPATTLGEDSADQAGHVDMVLDLAADQPELMVQEKADQGVVAALSALIQQRALADQVAALGGDPAAVSQAVAEAAPSVTVLDPPSSDRADAGVRYTTLMIVNILLFIVIMGGGQVIAMGVVEEKSSRIVEILLACVRPTSLLAGKVIGTGLAVISSYALIAVVAAATAAVMDVLPNTDLRLDSVVAVMLVWMVVGFATFAILFGAAGALVSRQEDMGNVTMPIMMLAMVPYMLSFVMAMGSPQSVVWRVLAYIPPFSAFLMPARLTFGYSDWGEQAIALAIALAVLPLLVRLAARVYTRAVTRMGARVPLKEVLGRRAA